MNEVALKVLEDAIRTQSRVRIGALNDSQSIEGMVWSLDKKSGEFSVNCASGLMFLTVIDGTRVELINQN